MISSPVIFSKFKWSEFQWCNSKWSKLKSWFSKWNTFMWCELIYTKVSEAISVDVISSDVLSKEVIPKEVIASEVISSSGIFHWIDILWWNSFKRSIIRQGKFSWMNGKWSNANGVISSGVIPYVVVLSKSILVEVI